MRRRKKLIIAILLVILIGLLANIYATLYMPDTTSALAEGEKNIMVCAIDESEVRDGMGACDMVFIVKLKDGNIVNYTAVYPGGLTHPTEKEPAEYQAMGAGEKLLLHDCFYSSDNEKGMKLAKEVVEYNKKIKIDAVVCINSQGVDEILQALNPLNIDGQEVNASGIDIIREEQYDNGNSRGEAVLKIVTAAADKAKDPACQEKVINAALEQYSKGNIIMSPQGLFMDLLKTKGIEKLMT